MRNKFADTFYELGREDPRLCIVVADISPAGSIAKFRTEFPDRFVNTGVAEQIMIGMTAGMAQRGLRPFAYTIATFALYRPFEMVRDDLCYQKSCRYRGRHWRRPDLFDSGRDAPRSRRCFYCTSSPQSVGFGSVRSRGNRGCYPLVRAAGGRPGISASRQSGRAGFHQPSAGYLAVWKTAPVASWPRCLHSVLWRDHEARARSG